MSAIFLDGFSHYGTGAFGSVAYEAMKDGTYSALGTEVVVGVTPSWDVPSADLCLSTWSTFADNGIVTKVLPAPLTHMFMSFRFAVDAFSNLRPLDFGNGVCLNQTNTGAIQLCYGGSFGFPGTVIATTATPVIVTQNWHFFELEIDTVAHTFVLRVDDPTGADTPVLNVTNANITGSIGLYSHFRSGNTGVGNPRVYIKDIFVRDTAGTVNNSWLGDRRIATLLPNADTATAGWTPEYYHQLGAGILNLTVANSCVSSPTATSLNIGAGDFTIEAFARFNALPASGSSVIFSRWDATNNRRSYQLFLGSVALNSGCLCFQTSTDGTNATISQPIVYPWTPNLYQWYHIAIVRASGQLLLFVDGEQFGLPIADSSTYFAGTAPFAIGAQVEGTTTVTASTHLSGWVDETRFTVGYARYTANFTPTTVEFGRNVTDDPQFADVALLAGYDTVIQDESSYARTMTARNSAAQQTTSDGPDVGAWSTIGKSTPDDNTFAEAPFVAATNILTLSAQPAANDTVTVGTVAGPTAGVYKFVTSLVNPFDVLIDTTLQNTLQNLYNAINLGLGSGTKYGTGTTANIDVTASQLPAGQMQVTANTAGVIGNSIAVTVSLTNGGGWTTATLAGGLDIPGPSNFRIDRPPPNTTIISAVQATYRALKSDAGLCSINSGFVGPLGGVDTSSPHNLTTSVNYYLDIYETDPDSGGAITPTTIVNGAIQLNRVT